MRRDETVERFVVVTSQPGYLPESDPVVLWEGECDEELLAGVMLEELERSCEALGWDRELWVGGYTHRPEFSDLRSERFWADMGRRLARAIGAGYRVVSVAVETPEGRMLPWVTELRVESVAVSEREEV